MSLDSIAWDQLDRAYVRRVSPTDVDRTLEVVERDKEGEAKLTIDVPNGWTAIWLRLGEKTKIEPLLLKQNVDGTVLYKEPDGEWVGLVIECKKTLKETNFSEACDQLKSGVARLELFARFLGIPIRRHKAWIATRDDRAFGPKSTNPMLARRQDLVSAYQARAVNNCAFTKSLPVEIVLLDGVGYGQTTLAAC